MPESIRIILSALLVALLCALCVLAECPEGDLQRDCEIDFADVRVLAEQWLLEPACAGGDCADLDGTDGVNAFDFALLTRNWRRRGNPLMINEFMASNTRFNKDPQGQYDDWIELYNAADLAVDVGGMYLTDDLNEPTMWRIPDDNPAETTIPPHGYLLIWADADAGDRPGLHANFELRGSGEEIGLFDSNATGLIDAIEYDDQGGDISFGRYPDGTGNWRYLGLPSPAAQNKGAYLGEVDEVRFSHKRGFYDSPFMLTMATETDGAAIYYTLDGQEPAGMGRSRVGYRYESPIPITGTTILRARAFKSGYKPSSLKSHTYLFGANSAIRSLPIVSLVGDEKRTFYEPSGVMAIVGGFYSGGVWQSDGPDSYNNVIMHGMAYERPVSFEFFTADDLWNFQENCGIRVHGSNWMRPRYRRCDGVWSGNCKFSFRLYFRGLYGQTWLNHKIFPYGQDRHNSIVLRGGHNDRTNPFIKDELLRRIHMDMGHAASTGTHANLFINGEYKGYFNPCEHIKDSFCQEYYNSNAEWDVMTMNGVRDGDSVSWNNMLGYAQGHDLSDDRYYAEFSKMLDIPAFADYLILQLWSGNWDWPQNNWAAASERSGNGIWRFFIWDIEGAMFSNRLNQVRFGELKSQGNANARLYQALRVNSNFKMTFADRIYKHFFNGGALAAENIRNRFYELRDELRGVIPNMNSYAIDTWVPNRLNIFLNACKAEGMYTFDGPTFTINGSYRQGGHVPVGARLGIKNSVGYGTIYYTIDGNDPRVPLAQVSPGQQVVLVPEDAPKKILVPAEPVGKVSGAVLSEYWTDITGGSVADLTSHEDYPHKPDAAEYLPRFEGPTNWASYYGCRISGFVHPPEDDDYTFWIASDDNGQLWLSTDEDPANKKLIASVPGWTPPREWTKYASQKSAPIPLAAGRRYYLEAVMKENAGGDNLAVTWEGGSIAHGEPIDGAYLSGPDNMWARLDYDDSAWPAWPSGTRGLGYELRPGDAVNYAGLIDADLQAQMAGKRTSCYVRIPFNLDSTDLLQLTLRIRYDDGFVAFINGTKVAARNFAAIPQWNSNAEAGRNDSQAVDFESIDLSDYTDTLLRGQNVLAIQALNVAAGSSDLLLSAELVAYRPNITGSGGLSPSAIRYTASTVLTSSTQIKARVLNGQTWSALNEAVFSVGPVAENLRITEIMYHPQDTNDPADANAEYIELQNIGSQAIGLALVRFSDGVDFVFPDRVLEAGHRVLVVKDITVFATRYPGFSHLVAGEYAGSLANNGERIVLEDAAGQTILSFKYEDQWRDITDGQGFSLTIIDATNPDPNSWNDKSAWRASAEPGGSPGWDDSGILPNPGDVVINEVLAHSHALAADWIELHNTTDRQIDVGGWYLSDDDANLKKYRIKDGTKLEPYGYLVLREDVNFGQFSSDPGRLEPFAFSENGETAYLSSVVGQLLGGFREKEDFGASQTGISFGRYFKASTGNYNFVPMEWPTPGTGNSDPNVGPIVITEIMYHPDWPEMGSYTNDSYEYVELRNIGSSPVRLYDLAESLPWKFTEGIKYCFPEYPGLVIPPGKYVVVARNPQAFGWRYPTVPAEIILGPYEGKLSDGGEALELSKPGDLDAFARRQYIRVERVVYSDGSHPGDVPGGVDLWPIEADGAGKSLHRRVHAAYGNDPANWRAADPSPGW